MPELASPKLRNFFYQFRLKPQLRVLTAWFICLLIFLISPSYKPFKDNKFRVHHLNSDAHKDIPTQNPLLNINSARLSELTELDGIGPVLAHRIIEYRDIHTKVKNSSDLLCVKGLGPKKLNKIKNKITF